MDKLGADFFATIEDIRTKFGVKPVAMVLPIGSENNFSGVIQVLEGKAWQFDPNAKAEPQEIPVPENLREKLAQMKQELIEAIAETDDILMEKYLNGEEINSLDRKSVV